MVAKFDDRSPADSGVIEIIELEADHLAEFEALAMCDCVSPQMDRLYGDPDLNDALSRDEIFQEVTAITRTLLTLSTADHANYARGLVRPAVEQLGRAPKRALVIGGGDGLVARRLLDEGTDSVVLVDVRKPITDAYSTGALGRELNGNALNDRRMTVVNAMADKWLSELVSKGKKQGDSQFDVIVLDLACTQLLQQTQFYRDLIAVLSKDGVLIAQDLFPLDKRYCEAVQKALEHVGLRTELKKHPLSSIPSTMSAFLVLGHQGNKSSAPTAP